MVPEGSVLEGGGQPSQRGAVEFLYRKSSALSASLCPQDHLVGAQPVKNIPSLSWEHLALT